jgi:hypothetical protein
MRPHTYYCTTYLSSYILLRYICVLIHTTSTYRRAALKELSDSVHMFILLHYICVLIHSTAYYCTAYVSSYILLHTAYVSTYRSAALKELSDSIEMFNADKKANSTSDVAEVP